MSKFKKVLCILGLIFILVTAFPVILFAIEMRLPHSTVDRTPITNPNKFDQMCIDDDLQRLWDPSYVSQGIRHFYEKTGVQLYVVTIDIENEESIVDMTTFNNHIKKVIESKYPTTLDYSVVLYKTNYRDIKTGEGKYDYDSIGQYDWDLYVGDNAQQFMDAEACTILYAYWDRAEMSYDDNAFEKALSGCANELLNYKRRSTLSVILVVALILIAAVALIVWIIYLRKKHDLLEDNLILKQNISEQAEVQKILNKYEDKE